MRRLALGALAITCTIMCIGCGDFELVGPPANVHPALSAQLIIENGDSAVYELHATLDRGSDDVGRPQRFTEDRLGMDDELVVHALGPAPRIWSYEWREVRTSADAWRDSLRLRAPSVSGTPTFAVTIPFARRVGPADITVVPGADLVLPIANVRGDTIRLTPRFSQWSVQLRDRCDTGSGSSTLSILGTGAIPLELRIPAPWINEAASAPFEICLEANALYQPADAPYPVSIVVGTRISWHVHPSAGA